MMIFKSRIPLRPALLVVAVVVSAIPAHAQRSFAGQDGQRIAQSGPRMLPPRPLRPPNEISDQDHAQYRMRSGENRSFEELLGRASRVGRGEFLAVEPNISTNIYRFKFLRSTGNMVWVDVDGRTGRVIAERE